jgi:hypothetical protein
MAYSKAKLKCSDDTAFTPFWRGKLSEKCSPISPIQTLLCVPFQHILIWVPQTLHAVA